MNKTFTLSILLLLISAGISLAQPAFLFTYDASGNRIKRELIDLSEHPGGGPGGPEAVAVEDDAELPASPEVVSGESSKSKQDLYSGPGGVSVFPNPTSDKVYLSITGEWLEQGPVSLTVLTAGGKTITTRQEAEHETELDFSGYAPGYYILKLSGGGATKEWVILKD